MNCSNFQALRWADKWAIVEIKENLFVCTCVHMWERERECLCMHSDDGRWTLLTQRVVETSLHPCVTSARSFKVVPTYTSARVIGYKWNQSTTSACQFMMNIKTLQSLNYYILYTSILKPDCGQYKRYLMLALFHLPDPLHFQMLLEE